MLRCENKHSSKMAIQFVIKYEHLLKFSIDEIISELRHRTYHALFTPSRSEVHSLELMQREVRDDYNERTKDQCEVYTSQFSTKSYSWHVENPEFTDKICVVNTQQDKTVQEYKQQVNQLKAEKESLEELIIDFERREELLQREAGFEKMILDYDDREKMLKSTNEHLMENLHKQSIEYKEREQCLPAGYRQKEKQLLEKLAEMERKYLSQKYISQRDYEYLTKSNKLAKDLEKEIQKQSTEYNKQEQCLVAMKQCQQELIEKLAESKNLVQELKQREQQLMEKQAEMEYTYLAQKYSSQRDRVKLKKSNKLAKHLEEQLHKKNEQTKNKLYKLEQTMEKKWRKSMEKMERTMEKKKLGQSQMIEQQGDQQLQQLKVDIAKMRNEYICQRQMKEQQGDQQLKVKIARMRNEYICQRQMTEQKHQAELRKMTKNYLQLLQQGDSQTQLYMDELSPSVVLDVMDKNDISVKAYDALRFIMPASMQKLFPTTHTLRRERRRRASKQTIVSVPFIDPQPSNQGVLEVPIDLTEEQMQTMNDET